MSATKTAVPVETKSATFVVPVQTLAVVACAADEASRYHMNLVQFRRVNGTLRLAATDGKVAAVHECLDAGEDATALIPASLLIDARKLAKKMKVDQIVVDVTEAAVVAKVIHSTKGEQYVTVARPEGRFPPIDSVLPSADVMKLRVCLGADVLQQIIDVAKCQEIGMQSIEISFGDEVFVEKNVCRIQKAIAFKTGETSGCLMPVTRDGARGKSTSLMVDVGEGPQNVSFVPEPGATLEPKADDDRPIQGPTTKPRKWKPLNVAPIQDAGRPGEQITHPTADVVATPDVEKPALPSPAAPTTVAPSEGVGARRCVACQAEGPIHGKGKCKRCYRKSLAAAKSTVAAAAV